MRQVRFTSWTLALTLTILIVPVAHSQAPTPTSSPSPPMNPTQPTQSQTPTPLPQIEKMEPAEAARGASVTFTGQNFPGNPDDITVYLSGNKPGKAASVVSPDKTKFIFAVPDDISLGRYNVRVECKLNNRAVPFSPVMPSDAMLTVFSEAGRAQPKITAVYPLVSYPDKEVYGFDVLGEGFSTRASDDALIVNQTEIPVCWDNNKDCKDDPSKAQGKVVNAQQLSFLWKIPLQYQGGAHLQIRVGQNYSPPFEVTLSRVTSTFPKIVSIVVVLALFGIVLWLLSRGYRNVIEGRKYSVLSALFLDAETDTYSLSRLQFFVWTAVGILSYLYLLLSRSLVQGRLEFVDVPAGLPGIILISAGTTVMAQGITKSKGTKGSGEIQPSLTDLISTGGVVVPERFQFFVWTILGAAVFVFLVFLSDPGTIKDLPQVPSGFLELMGVSSAGYLGGKVARRAGPVIDEIIAKFSTLELTLKGRNLSKDASFRIGDDEISSDLIENLKPAIVEVDDQGEPNTAKLLKLKITTPKPDWLKDNAALTIVNPDGQKSVLKYVVGPVVTGPIKASVDSDGQVITLVAQGLNLSSESKVAIESPEGTPWAEQPTVDSKTPNTLQITSKGPKSGVLVITNPDQRSYRTSFTVL
jgi:hypothetical protein